MERRLDASETSLDAPMRSDEQGDRTQGDFVRAAPALRPDVQVEAGEFGAILREKLHAFGDDAARPRPGDLPRPPAQRRAGDAGPDRRALRRHPRARPPDRGAPQAAAAPVPGRRARRRRPDRRLDRLNGPGRARDGTPSARVTGRSRRRSSSTVSITVFVVVLDRRDRLRRPARSCTLGRAGRVVEGLDREVERARVGERRELEDAQVARRSPAASRSRSGRSWKSALSAPLHRITITWIVEISLIPRELAAMTCRTSRRCRSSGTRCSRRRRATRTRGREPGRRRAHQWPSPKQRPWKSIVQGRTSPPFDWCDRAPGRRRPARPRRPRRRPRSPRTATSRRTAADGACLLLHGRVGRLLVQQRRVLGLVVVLDLARRPSDFELRLVAEIGVRHARKADQRQRDGRARRRLPALRVHFREGASVDMRA